MCVRAPRRNQTSAPPTPAAADSQSSTKLHTGAVELRGGADLARGARLIQYIFGSCARAHDKEKLAFLSGTMDFHEPNGSEQIQFSPNVPENIVGNDHIGQR